MFSRASFLVLPLLLLALSCRDDTDVVGSESCSASCPEAYTKRVAICQDLHPDAEKALVELRTCVKQRCEKDCDLSKSTALKCTECKDSACPEARAVCERN